MAPSLLHPPGDLSPAEAYSLYKKAPSELRDSPESISASPLLSLLSAPETPELWIKYENLLQLCLRAGDDVAAHRFLERLVKRFGDDNERMMAWKGLIKEATAKNNGELEAVLKEYDSILAAEPNNIPIAKRRIALLRSLGRVPDAVSGLVALLDMSPTDAEAWSELSDVYLSQGLYPQAIYALEEVLVLVPNAWNLHARLGEVSYMAATAQSAANDTTPKHLSEATKRFCRSIELCDDYLRGYYGLKLVTSRLLQAPIAHRVGGDQGDLKLPDTATLKQLDELATQKLAEIVRRYAAREPSWRGYDEAEIKAARELLALHSPEVAK
ncbi:tetratricopeptide repeat domain-containing protein [Gaeumannomyces tritici R3-111a-1]|uniref:ER membrane protein complex subunit 2 n=1 Tax=Gaeumannomyces tritici (strain R3-111a-1) TaxID=644352 RepID=J3NN32_GAET3|nr:tetratricopeptide repeat domain-containing protein [Gaeumannomyces tritici R3-111a-1]EJT77584.1 tetratricopeptide repeat domain-containing protein [Gaeumannomyces tritici R3-111a-1]